MGMLIQTEYLDSPAAAGRVWDLIVPTAEPLPMAIFFIHGGGWRMGSRDRYHTIIEVLADRGVTCATTDYSLGETTVAKQLTDVRQSYARFIQKLRDMGRPESVLVFGSSAGAHLALLLSLARPGECGDAEFKDAELADACKVRPVGVAVQAAPVTFEPWEDIFPGMWGPMQRAVGTPHSERPDLYTQVSPIHYIDKDSPPVFLMESQYEHMVPPHVTRMFYDRMVEFGRRVEHKTYPATEHGFFYDTTRWQQAEAIDDLFDFAQSLASPPAAGRGVGT